MFRERKKKEGGGVSLSLFTSLIFIKKTKDVGMKKISLVDLLQTFPDGGATQAYGGE